MTMITFAGNLAADPELRFTPSGREVVRLRVLENRRRRTADGQGWEDGEPNRYRVEAWGALAKNIADSCTKGSRIIVAGTVSTDRWTDKETGEDRTAQVVTAEDIGFSMKFHTVEASKAVSTRTQQAADPESNSWAEQDAQVRDEHYA